MSQLCLSSSSALCDKIRYVIREKIRYVLRDDIRYVIRYVIHDEIRYVIRYVIRCAYTTLNFSTVNCYVGNRLVKIISCKITFIELHLVQQNFFISSRILTALSCPFLITFRRLHTSLRSSANNVLGK